MTDGREEKDVLIAPTGAVLSNNLTGTESITLNVHQHPVILGRPIGFALLATFAAIWMVTGDDPWLPPFVVLLVLGLWVRVGIKEYERRRNSFVATNKRIMKVEGIFHVRVPMMRHSKVTDMSLDLPLIGRILGFGSITIESAGQNQPIRDIRYIRYPTQTYRRLCGAIFDDEFPPLTPKQARADEGWVRRIVEGAAPTVTRVRRRVGRPPNGSGPAPGATSPSGAHAGRAPNGSRPKSILNEAQKPPQRVAKHRPAEDDTNEIPTRPPGRR